MNTTALGLALCHFFRNYSKETEPDLWFALTHLRENDINIANYLLNQGFKAEIGYPFEDYNVDDIVELVGDLAEAIELNVGGEVV